MNSDCIVIMGSNMAEAHPVGFQWVMEAKARGARLIHIDPRFTRTSAVADTYVPIRAGSDIAFLGGVINYILSNELDFREYVKAFTNAAFLVSEEYQDTEDLDGLFSGYDADTGTYDRSSWQYQGADQLEPDEGDSEEPQEESRTLQTGAAGAPLEGITDGVAQDPTLQHPRCVYQVLKRHFARYTPEMVERVCGTPPEQFRAVCEAWASNSGRERTGALVYSVGWTQHSVGAQYIRSGAIIQLLLGNMGRPGGGIFALRGHASIQGSTDIPTLFDLLPGYLPMPSADLHDDLAAYLDTVRSTTQKGYWTAADTYIVSLLKEYFGEHATAENDFGFDLMPRISGDHGTYRQVMDMVDGDKIFGYFLLGQNPAVGSAHGKLQRLGMANLDWVVVRDLAMIESATFWKDAPEIETGEIVPEECRTEVFFFPAASHVEKEGTFTQTQRMLQWRDKAVEPTGDQRSELWFFYHLGRMIQERLAASTDPRDEPVQKMDWSYHVEGSDSSGAIWGTLARTVRGGRPPAHQRLRRRHGGARRRLPRPQGGRLHRVRLLDLLRGLRGRREPGRAPQAARRAGRLRQGVGLDLAGEPPHALQPLLGGRRREAVERAQEAALVGRRARGVGRGRRPGLPGDHPARARPGEGGERAGRAARRRRVHHAGRREGVAVRAERDPGRAAAHPLRAPRVAGAQPALRPAGQPDGQGLRPRRQPVQPDSAGTGQPH